MFVSTAQAKGDNFGFSTVEEKVQFLERYFAGEELSKEDHERFKEHTDIEEKISALPWSFTADWYKLIRGAGMLFQVHEILSVDNLDIATAQASTIMVDGVRVVNPGVTVALLAEAVMDIFQLVEVGKDFKSLYGTNPGAKIRLLEVKFEMFSRLLYDLEVIKALQGDTDPKSLELMAKVMAESSLYFTHASRQIAGLKLATGGLVVAYNLEALIASSLLDLEPNYRESVFKSWKTGYEGVVKQEVSWFSGFGDARETFKYEAETLLSDLEKSTSDKAFNKTVRSSTLTHKTGVLLMGLLQENIRTADAALEAIEESEKHLKSLGIENERLNMILTPLTFSESFSRSHRPNSFVEPWQP